VLVEAQLSAGAKHAPDLGERVSDHGLEGVLGGELCLPCGAGDVVAAAVEDLPSASTASGATWATSPVACWHMGYVAGGLLAGAAADALSYAAAIAFVAALTVGSAIWIAHDLREPSRSPEPVEG
jgi:hypothetical protein